MSTVQKPPAVLLAEATTTVEQARLRLEGSTLAAQVVQLLDAISKSSIALEVASQAGASVSGETFDTLDYLLDRIGEEITGAAQAVSADRNTVTANRDAVAAR